MMERSTGWKRHGVAVFLLLIAACTRAPESGGGGAGNGGSAMTKAVIARVDAFEGEAFVWHDGQRAAAAIRAPLAAGDRLETGARGKVRVILTDGSVVSIGAGTQLKIDDLQVAGGNRSARIEVALGMFWMHVTKWTGSGTSQYEVATPNAVAGVRGTTLWGDTQVDAICALEGTIEVRSLKEPGLPAARLDAGNCASALSQGRLAPMAPTPDEIQGYLDKVLIRTPVPP